MFIKKTMQKTKPQSINKFISESNKLITAKYYLSAIESRIMTLVAAQIDYKDTDFKYYKIKIRDLITPGGSNEAIYSRLEPACNQLCERTLIFKDEMAFEFINWVTSITHIRNTDYIEVGVDPKLKPYLLDLKEKGDFTHSKVNQLLRFRSFYTRRIYKNLCRWRDKGKWFITVKDLRQMLGCTDKYLDNTNFKLRVLDVAQKELQNSDLPATYSIQKKYAGKGMGFITWTIQTPNQPTDKIDYYTNKLLNLGLSKSQTNTIIEKVPSEEIGKTMHELQIKKLSDPAANMGAYGWTTFKNKYQLYPRENDN